MPLLIIKKSTTGYGKLTENGVDVSMEAAEQELFIREKKVLDNQEKTFSQ